jgi:hypothetical protein
VTKCWELSEGRIDVHSERRSGGSSLISAEPLQKTEGKIRVNQHRTVRGLCYTEGDEFLDSIVTGDETWVLGSWFSAS